MHADGGNTEDRWADVTKVTGAFRDSEKEPYFLSDRFGRMN
jgi:hypothetical protein